MTLPLVAASAAALPSLVLQALLPEFTLYTEFPGGNQKYPSQKWWEEGSWTIRRTSQRLRRDHDKITGLHIP
jgi:hypothetical protein